MSRKQIKKQENVKNDECNQMKCHPSCPFFLVPEGNNEWEYDPKISYLKRKKTNKKYMCSWDGHEIVSWYDCPRADEKEN